MRIHPPRISLFQKGYVMKKRIFAPVVFLLCFAFLTACHAGLSSSALSSSSLPSSSLPASAVVSSLPSSSGSPIPADSPLIGVIGEAWGYKTETDEYAVLSLKEDGTAGLQNNQYFYTGTYTVSQMQVTVTFTTQQTAYEWGAKSVPAVEPAEYICIFDIAKGENFDAIPLDDREDNMYITLTLVGGDKLFASQQMDTPYTFIF